MFGDPEVRNGERILAICIKKLQTAIEEEELEIQQGTRLLSEYETSTFGKISN